MSFFLNIHPWIHVCTYKGNKWTGEFIEQEHLTPEQENALGEKEHRELINRRNNFPMFPLVNFTTQYGLGCFEGVKAFPHRDGQLKLFRAERNCARLANSMKGLRMPQIDAELLLAGIIETIKRNHKLGFAPNFNPMWANNNWQTAEAVYVRPFTYAEPGIGVDVSKSPWVITICTSVSNYFTPGIDQAITTKRIRATPNGTGSLKIAANYVTSVLAKSEAIEQGYMEAIFLDATHREYIEEGSSCNFFAVFPGNKVITPLLHDTVLSGITRLSIIELLKKRGIKILEEDLSIHRVLSDAVECFVSGTAAGIIPLASITHNEKKSTFRGTEENSLSNSLLRELKGIQYGAVEDHFNWMIPVKN